MGKNGGKHGGTMKAIGYAYVGLPAEIVPHKGITDEDNDDTKVKLYYDNGYKRYK